MESHTQIHKVVSFKIITRLGADTDLAGKKGSYWFYSVQCVCVLMVLQKNWQRSVHSVGREEEKLQFPAVIPSLWNAGFVVVTAEFQ